MSVLLEIAAVLIGSYLLGNLLGYVVHRLLHFKWMGRPYQDHYYHHVEVYPPDDYLSDEYREPPAEASQAKYYVTAFALACSPLLLWHWAYGLLALVMSLSILKLNAYVHDSLHIRGHRWEKYRWFRHLRDVHYHHHVDVATNFGIFSFFPDRLLRTYAGKPQESPR